MNILMAGFRQTKRSILVNVILFFTFVTWYYLFSILVLRQVAGSSDETYMVVSAAFNFIIVITLLFASFFAYKLNKLCIIYEASIVTSIVTILLLFTQYDTIYGLIVVFMAGIFFSIGQLTFFRYFWNLTEREERGRVAGIIGFFSLPLLNFVTFLAAATLDFSGIVTLSLILSLGPIIVKLLKPEKTMLTKETNERRNYSEKRIILLYLIPWILFSLVNATFARSMSLGILQQVSSSFYMFLTVLQVIAAAFGALGGGVIADFFGRRLSLAFSLTLYGIASALAGFARSYAILSFVYVANGLAWGILLTMYTFVVWGDLANKENCAKMYSIGLITFYFVTGIGILLAPQISQISLIVSSLISCALMFFSNLPLMLAPELSSSEFREKIRLKRYMTVLRKNVKNQG